MHLESKLKIKCAMKGDKLLTPSTPANLQSINRRFNPRVHNTLTGILLLVRKAVK